MKKPHNVARVSRKQGLDEPLYLKRVILDDVRCFEHLELDLEAPNSGPRSWGVILGDNGVGKTTLLRSIAMGMCDEASAAGLLRELYGDWLSEATSNKKVRSARIKLEFFPTEDADEISVTTEVLPTAGGYSRVAQRATFGTAAEFPWDRIFACGYGSARRGFGTKDIDDYATIDAVYSLFNYDSPLQNPELVLRRLAAGREDISNLLRSLADVLQLQSDSVALTRKGLEVRGEWGTFQPIRGIGDGFQATLAWIADLIGWSWFYDDARDLRDISGIVLVDELEQHLHPKWQRRIVGLLSKHFPKLQFIATTHTPMCAIATTDLDAGQCELIVLRREGRKILSTQNISPPQNLRADQVLTSDLFGLATTSSDTMAEAVARYAALGNRKNLQKSELVEREHLFRFLQERLSSLETPFETEIRDMVLETLKQRNNAMFKDEAVGFEVLRQLRSLSHD